MNTLDLITNNMKKKIILLAIILTIVVIAVCCFFLFRYKSSPEEKAILDQLESEEITVEKVHIKSDEVIIEYSQPIDFTNKDGELYATWAYIFSVATGMSPDASTIIINCEFKDGEKVRLTADKETITFFINEELTPTEFLQKIELEVLTRGPKI